MRKVIISVAPVGPKTPIIPEEVAQDVVKCVEEGAAICHLHSRDENGKLIPDTSMMVDTFERIRAKTDVVVQASTGGVSDMSIEDRCNPLKYWRVESASLNGGTMNFGESIYVNSFEDIRYCAKECYDRDILPEIEVFDIGMINNIKLVSEEQMFHHPIWYNLVFGHKGGMPATIDALIAFSSFVPKGQIWGVTHFGRMDWRFIGVAIALGASVVRVGFEDSDRLDAHTGAQYNWELIRQLASIIRQFGLETATPEEARKILNLSPVQPFEKGSSRKHKFDNVEEVDLYE